ncbi:MAG: hypothetical protein ABI759_01840 [Candidatus Solibacter sp.]
MSSESIADEGLLREGAVAANFLRVPNEESFADLFKVFTPRLIAFFRARGCELVLAEALAQEVLLTVFGPRALGRFL